MSEPEPSELHRSLTAEAALASLPASDLRRFRGMLRREQRRRGATPADDAARAAAEAKRARKRQRNLAR